MIARQLCHHQHALRLESVLRSKKQLMGTEKNQEHRARFQSRKAVFITYLLLVEKEAARPEAGYPSASSAKTIVPPAVCRVLITSTSCVVPIFPTAWFTTSIVPSGK